MTHALKTLLAPRSIAVVGASPRPGSFGGAVLTNLMTHYSGTVYPINPQYENIQDLRCYPSLKDLPAVPDCIGIAVAAVQVEGVLRQAADIGARNAIVFSSGFAETGTEQGRALQARITAIAQQYGIRLLGPNCTGMVNIRSGAACNILPSIKDLPMVPGHIGIVGQSGALSYVVLQAMHRGVGFSQLISTGNSCDLDIADLIDYLIDDSDTHAIICLFESVPDGEKLKRVLLRALDADKPVIVYKIGVTQSGMKAALSHSGMLAGDAQAYDALFVHTGAIVVDQFEAMLETAVFFSRAGRPGKGGVGILSGSGGSVVMAADKADQYGVPLPAPQPGTIDALAKRLPAFATLANPADITAESIRDESAYRECVEIFARDTNFASTAILMPSAHGQAAATRAEGLDSFAKQFDRPLTLVWINEWHEGPGTRTYDSSRHLSMFRSLDRCMNAYRLWFDRARLQAARSSMVPFSLPQAKAASDLMLDACTRGKEPSLTEVQAKRLFSIYGIVTTDDCICQTQAEAMAHADTIGYPVVAKIVSAAVQHKSDMGGVKINLSNATALSQAWQEITDSARVFGLPESEWKISVQPMIKPGVEMLVGARIDPQFGPLVVFGFGGTLVEVLRDVAVRLAPVDAQAVRSALDRLRLRPLLDGVRGAQPADIEFFVDQVVRLSHLISDQADRITEIDINPIVLHNHGGVAVDGVVVLRDASN